MQTLRIGTALQAAKLLEVQNNAVSNNDICLALVNALNRIHTLELELKRVKHRVANLKP